MNLPSDLLEESAEALYDGAPCGYLSTLPDGRIIRVNQTFLDWTGYSRSALLGRSLQDLFPAGARIIYEIQLAPLLQMQGYIREIAVDLVCPGREPLPALLNAVQRRDEAGRPLANRVTVFNATDRRSYERELLTARQEAEEASAALKRLNETLEERVAQEVAERLRTTEQLRQSQKMEALGQLTGGVAHDFNNLLTVILGNTELIVEAGASAYVRSLAQMCLEAAERAAALTQQLLAFGRRQSLRPEPLLLDEVVGGLLGLLRRTLAEHIEIRIETHQGQVRGLADRSFLESALLNLAVNARDAMPQGGTLTIATGARNARRGEGSLPMGQPVVFVTVADTGTGMPPEVLERVFEPFFTTKDVGQGTGLGLSMVFGFAQQSGGHVSIESKEGEGTSVTILLRAAEDHRARAPSAENRIVPLGGQERVLVVEDEPQVLSFVSSQLQNLGYQVTGVASAVDALAVLDRDRDFDLVFTDVVLPHGMSGIDLTRHVRAMGLRTRVLLTSGYPEETFEQHGRPASGTLLLRKPYKQKELAEMIQSALGSRSFGHSEDRTH